MSAPFIEIGVSASNCVKLGPELYDGLSKPFASQCRFPVWLKASFIKTEMTDKINEDFKKKLIEKTKRKKMPKL